MKEFIKTGNIGMDLILNYYEKVVYEPTDEPGMNRPKPCKVPREGWCVLTYQAEHIQILYPTENPGIMAICSVPSNAILEAAKRIKELAAKHFDGEINY